VGPGADVVAVVKLDIMGPHWFYNLLWEFNTVDRQPDRQTVNQK